MRFLIVVSKVEGWFPCIVIIIVNCFQLLKSYLLILRWRIRINAINRTWEIINQFSKVETLFNTIRYSTILSSKQSKLYWIETLFIEMKIVSFQVLQHDFQFVVFVYNKIENYITEWNYFLKTYFISEKTYLILSIVWYIIFWTLPYSTRIYLKKIYYIMFHSSYRILIMQNFKDNQVIASARLFKKLVCNRFEFKNIFNFIAW